MQEDCALTPANLAALDYLSYCILYVHSDKRASLRIGISLKLPLQPPREPCARRSMAMAGDAASHARGRVRLSLRDMEHLKLPDDQFKVYLSVYQASTKQKPFTWENACEIIGNPISEEKSNLRIWPSRQVPTVAIRSRQILCAQSGYSGSL